MDSIFVLEVEREPIYLADDPANIIYIRKRVSHGQQIEVAGRARETKDKTRSEFQIADDALMLFGILGWEGPKFQLGGGETAPVTLTYIRALEGSDPLVLKAIDELTKRFNPKPSPDPKSPGSSGSTTAGDGDSEIPTRPENLSNPLESGTFI